VLVECWENAKLKCSRISKFQNRESKVQQKYNVLQYAAGFCTSDVYPALLKH